MRPTAFAQEANCSAGAHRIQDQHKVAATVVTSYGAEMAITRLTKGFARVAHLRTAQHGKAHDTQDGIARR